MQITEVDILSKKCFYYFSCHCKEPTQELVIKPEDWIKLEIKETELGLILELYNSDKMIDKFKVNSLVENNLETALTLKRLEIE